MLDFSVHPAPFDCVLVHGAGGNNLLWRRTMQYLSGTGRAIAINLPGHPTGDISCHTISDYSEKVHSFMVDSDLERPALCGHSMGSAIALQLAVDHPGDIAGLVLVGAGAKLGVDPRIVDGLKGAPLSAIERLITPMSFYAVSLELGREARSALSISNLAVFLNDYLACDGFDVRRELSRISARTLIICGEDDRMTPPKWSHYLHSNILSSSAFFVRESGHMLPLEKPETCARLMQSFLAELSR